MEGESADAYMNLREEFALQRYGNFKSLLVLLFTKLTRL
jgi:hypothetical protein